MDTSWCIPSVGRFQQHRYDATVCFVLLDIVETCWKNTRVHECARVVDLWCHESWCYAWNSGYSLSAMRTPQVFHHSVRSMAPGVAQLAIDASVWSMMAPVDGKAGLLHTLVPTHPYAQIHPGWPPCAISAQKWSEPVGGSYYPLLIIISHS